MILFLFIAVALAALLWAVRPHHGSHTCKYCGDFNVGYNHIAKHVFKGDDPNVQKSS